MHDFSPDPATGYHECVDCGLLSDPDVTAWVTVYCMFKACQSPANHDAPCVAVRVDARAICSYCDRFCGAEDAADDDVFDWFVDDDDLDEDDEPPVLVMVTAP